MFTQVKTFLTDPSVRYRALLVAGSAAGILASYSLSAKLSELRTNRELVEFYQDDTDTSE